MNDQEPRSDDVIIEIDWYELEVIDDADEFDEWQELDVNEVVDVGEFTDLVLPSISELAALVADPSTLVDLDSSVLEPLPDLDAVG